MLSVLVTESVRKRCGLDHTSFQLPFFTDVVTPDTKQFYCLVDLLCEWGGLCLFGWMAFS